jgi:hypothetical protein
VGVNASKNNMSSTHHGAYALKNIQRVPSACKWSILAKHGAFVSAIVKNNIFQTSEELEPGPRHPNYMRLHRWWEILDLGHGNCTSEHGEVSLHPSQKYLSLSDWRSPCCWFGSCGWYHLWLRMSPGPREFSWMHSPHIYT